MHALRSQLLVDGGILREVSEPGIRDPSADEGRKGQTPMTAKATPNLQAATVHGTLEHGGVAVDFEVHLHGPLLEMLDVIIHQSRQVPAPTGKIKFVAGEKVASAPKSKRMRGER
jgi:hypothetical protein